MTDPTADTASDRPLIPANQNPWYVLATLYGEQEGEETDVKLLLSNSSVWNAWSCQNLSDAAWKADPPPLLKTGGTGWASIEAEVTQRHKSEWFRRNGEHVPYPGLPDVTKMVDFKGVIFSNPLLMVHCVFSEAAMFNHASFRRRAEFIMPRFRRYAAFGQVTFSEDVQFVAATFGGDAKFNRATFSGAAEFHFAHFHGDAQFRSATFSRRVSFVGATFGKEGGKQAASFEDCQFDKPLNFRDAKFLAQYPVFSGAITADRNVFTAKPDHWPETTTQDPDQARESCAAIRHMLDKQGLPEEAHFFFRREMEFAGQIGSYWQRLPYRLYGQLSDYGHSIRLPFEWLTALIVAGWVLFSGWLALFQRADAGARWHQPLVEGLSQSVANTLPFLGLMRSMHPDFYGRAPALIDFLSIAQSLFGIVLLFLLGLGLRTRFRMR
jgi:hypothetical protein